MKKLMIIVLIISALAGLLIIGVSAYSMPTNTNNYQYILVYKEGTTKYWNCIYSDNVTVVNDTIYTCEGAWQKYGSIDYGASWGTPDASQNGFSTSWDPIYEVVYANYDIGDYIAQGAEWITADYIGAEPPTCEFILKGGLEIDDISIGILYTGLDGVQSANRVVSGQEIEYDEISGYYYFDWANVPWGFGENRISIQNLMMTEIYDVITLTLSVAHDEICEIIGVENGVSYEVPPAITIKKLNYINTVGFYVNGEKYKNIKGYTGSYSMYDLYTDNIILGENTVYIKDEVTGEIIESKTFNITRGYIKEDGTYWNSAWDYDGYNPYTGTGGDGETPSSFENLKGMQPEKPGHDATIVDWLIYIGEMIGYVFSIAVAAIIEFAKSVGNMLASLFGMIQPILVFIQQMFNSLPGPISAGLYALFTLSCVLAMLKILRRG